MPSISRLELWNAYYGFKSQSDAMEQFVKFVFDKLNGQNFTTEWDKKVRIILQRFLAYCNRSYRSSAVCHKNSLFLEKNRLWLSGTETFPDVPVSPQPGSSCSTQSCNTDTAGPSRRGRPKEGDFSNLKEDSKRKRTKEMRDSKDVDEIAFAAEVKLREKGKSTEAKIVQKVLKSSPRTVSLIFLNISNIKRTPSGNLDDGSPKQFTLEEAVVHQIECDFSKEQYILNRQRLNDKNCKVFPSYEKLSACKLQCLPSNLSISEQKASVSLQDMLNHTVSRLASVQEEVFTSDQLEGNKLELVSKIGFDGSANPAQYNQVWKDFPEASDSNMVLTALVPLLLHQRNEMLEDVKVLWMNCKPSSIVHCRPLELEFTKESAAFIKNKAKELIEARDNLQETKITVNGKEFSVKHIVMLTMVDGKVTSAMTETGSATCNVCKATPAQMNNIDGVLLRECDTSALNYGLSVLHLNIRFLEYFMNIATRRGVAEKCYGKYTPEETAAINGRRKYICKRFKDEIGLLIDQTSSRGGNTNTGNNARRFFDNHVKGLLVHTDPVIASLRRPVKPKGRLDNQVIAMLIGPEKSYDQSRFLLDQESDEEM
ncbi:ATP synthase gamma chain [Frankliniella fusca]|uniref:ATP synthase gamma chain n=1 Tax=Frankliniella fusca TaxID=407009 RepID=A0AAE1GXQ1_9NEOP|nr:ATP synthase gamma chain [Frankliniella fusca]